MLARASLRGGTVCGQFVTPNQLMCAFVLEHEHANASWIMLHQLRVEIDRFPWNEHALRGKIRVKNDGSFGTPHQISGDLDASVFL